LRPDLFDTVKSIPDALGNIGDFLGGIGAVGTLLYLATQIRQNTQMMRSAARQQLTLASQDNIYRWAEYAPAVIAAFSSEKQAPADSFRVAQLCRGMFRGLENHAYQHRIGMLDASEWAAMCVNMKKMFGIPIVAKNWGRARDEFSDIFVAELESIVAEHD
jgi:hypothetical protein